MLLLDYADDGSGVAPEIAEALVERMRGRLGDPVVVLTGEEAGAGEPAGRGARP